MKVYTFLERFTKVSAEITQGVVHWLRRFSDKVLLANTEGRRYRFC